MKTLSIFRLFLMATLAVALNAPTLIRADGSAQDALRQVQTLLRHAAWDDDAGAAPNADKRTSFLKQADELLKTVPVGGYRGHLMKARQFVKDAMDGVAKGASEQQVTGFIHDAESEVRTID